MYKTSHLCLLCKIIHFIYYILLHVLIWYFLYVIWEWTHYIDCLHHKSYNSPVFAIHFLYVTVVSFTFDLKCWKNFILASLPINKYAIEYICLGCITEKSKCRWFCYAHTYTYTQYTYPFEPTKWMILMIILMFLSNSHWQKSHNNGVNLSIMVLVGFCRYQVHNIERLKKHDD